MADADKKPESLHGPAVQSPGKRIPRDPHLAALDLLLGLDTKHVEGLGHGHGLFEKRVADLVHAIVVVLNVEQHGGLSNGQTDRLGAALELPQPPGLGEEIVAQALGLPELVAVGDVAVAVLGESVQPGDKHN